MKKRKTIQQQLVFDALNELQNHPTAQEIHDKIQRQHNSISIATVYSNLKKLVKSKEVRSLSFDRRADRYDHNTTEHYHLRCRDCGAFCDLPGVPMMKIDTQIAENSGYTVEGYEILFHGTCPACQK